MAVLRWVRLVTGYIFFICCLLAACYYETSVYLIQQAKGQLSVLFNTQSLEEYREQSKLSATELHNLDLVERIKRFSVDSLDYKPTKNFTTIFDQKKAPALWAITACKPFSFEAYTWRFPIVGEVSYKGFFKK